eukprot:scaffold274513_cov33-Tisochrysis_lutea.AAC.6
MKDTARARTGVRDVAPEQEWRCTWRWFADVLSLMPGPPAFCRIRMAKGKIRRYVRIRRRKGKNGRRLVGTRVAVNPCGRLRTPQLAEAIAGAKPRLLFPLRLWGADQAVGGGV